MSEGWLILLWLAIYVAQGVCASQIVNNPGKVIQWLFIVILSEIALTAAILDLSNTHDTIIGLGLLPAMIFAFMMKNYNLAQQKHERYLANLPYSG